MRVLHLDAEPLSVLSFVNAAPRSRGGGPERAGLPVLRGEVDRLPRSLAALLVASDLQGRELVPKRPAGAGEPRLLGEALCDHLVALASEGRLPPPEETGVVLCGDLFARPASDKRGGAGDASPVWRAFSARFRWVAGVAGNHDTYGDGPGGLQALRAHPGVHNLDGESCTLDGLRIGGVGGVVGDPRKLQRKAPERFLDLLERLLRAGQDLIALHESPAGPRESQIGNGQIAELLALAPLAYRHVAEDPPLVVCGHAAWREALAELEGGVQVLNANGRAVLLEPRDRTTGPGTRAAPRSSA